VATSTSDKKAAPVGPEDFADADRKVDARGLLCPEPLVRCRQAMRGLPGGATIHVIATDLHAEIDFEVFARRTRNQLVRREWRGGEFHVLIRKA
jgi:tRNA 2-thiouridine synthesizing protein A